MILRGLNCVSQSMACIIGRQPAASGNWPSRPTRRSSAPGWSKCSIAATTISNAAALHSLKTAIQASAGCLGALVVNLGPISATQEIGLAQLHAVVAQDRVRGGDVEIQVRQDEIAQIIQPLEM